jgi:hypothetical protein
MAVTVQITDEALLTELMSAFSRSGCRVDRATESACHVSYPLASNEREALIEVAFFLRAWQLEHPDVGTSIAA